MRYAILITVFATALAGCSTDPSKAEKERTPTMTSDSLFDLASLAGRTWVAEDIDGRGVMDTLQSCLLIVSAAEVAGLAGCNSFHGSAEFSPGAVRIGPLASTRKMCPPAIMDQETKFLAALESARTARMSNGLLYLADDSGATTLRFWERK